MERLSSRQWAADVFLALAFMALGQFELRHLPDTGYHAGDEALNTVTLILGAAPLAIRRWKPLLAVTAAALPHVAASLVTVHALTFWGTALPMAILCYTGGRWISDGRMSRLTLVPPAALLATYGIHVPAFRHLEDYLFTAALWGGTWLAGLAIARLERQRAALQSAMARLQAQEEERRSQVLLEERTRIAREMHDVMAHGVSLMVVQAGAARVGLSGADDRARESMLTVEVTGRSVLSELRRTVTLLRDESQATVPSRGLRDAPDLVASMRASGLDVTLEMEPSLGMDDALQLVVYRILQESLTNVLRHAGPVPVTVRVSRDDDLRVEVVDAGAPGTRPRVASEQASTGAGLVGMAERVAMYGGEFSAGPQGPGFAVLARIPMAADR